MIEDYLNQSGYRVNRGIHELYDGVPTASPLTLHAAPTTSFRCRVTVSAVAGHTDCSGFLTIGSETLTFTVAGTKTTTVLLSALPAVTYSNLDCNILITAIDSGGAPISSDTQTALDCRFQDTQKSYRLPSGEFSLSDAIAYTNDSSCVIGTLFSQGGYDYAIRQVSIMTGLDGVEEGRKLFLEGKTLAPATRAVAANIPGTVAPSDVMLKSVYDIDVDGIADTAEGIREVESFPANPKKGDLVMKDGEIYVCTGT